MRIIVIFVIGLGLFICTGCQTDFTNGGVPQETDASGAATPLSTLFPASLPPEISTPDRINATMTELPERVPPTESNTPMVGQVPADLLESILKDLATKIGAAPENITVIQAQSVIWNDGSLGCGKPGEFYTQAQVNGYWVILETDGRTYDYRATDRGYFFLCEGGSHPNPPQGTPSS